LINEKIVFKWGIRDYTAMCKHKSKKSQRDMIPLAFKTALVTGNVT